MSVTIPLYLAEGIDLLTAGNSEDVPRIAALVAVLGVLVMLVRTLSRVAFSLRGGWSRHG